MDNSEDDNFGYLESIEFKHHVLRFNCHVYPVLLDESIPYFPKMLDQEVMNNLDYYHQQCLQSVNLIDVMPTPKNVKNLTKKKIVALGGINEKNIKKLKLLNMTFSLN